MGPFEPMAVSFSALGIVFANTDYRKVTAQHRLRATPR
jgi:hypothetical protein